MKTQRIKTFSICLIFLLNFHFGQAQKPSDATLPSTYNFDYIYKLKMTHKKDNINFDYYLKSGSKYFGFDSPEMANGTPDAKVFMVMDNERQVTAMFMEMMGKKVVQKTKLRGTDIKGGEEDYSDYDFKQIDSKTILGYECEGFVSESDEMKITFYITDDVPVSFNQVLGANPKNLPKGFNPALMKKYAENGLMLEMIFVDKKKSKNSMTMECVALEKTDFSLDTSKYGSMMSAFGGGN